NPFGYRGVSERIRSPGATTARCDVPAAAFPVRALPCWPARASAQERGMAFASPWSACTAAPCGHQRCAGSGDVPLEATPTDLLATRGGEESAWTAQPS